MQTLPAEVIAAFGVTGEPRRLPGGKGGTWRVGDVILKPAEGEVETRWRAGVLAGLPESPDFRIARPLRAADGDWLAHGWEAQRAVAGHHDQRRVDEVVQAGTAFHRAIATLPRPSFLDVRDDVWSHGDRLAWGDIEEREPSRLLTRLLPARRPVEVASQVVHGDLLGNVLFAAGQAPAIIDWPAYFRPPAWAYAVAVTDAMIWHGCDYAVLDRWAHLPGWDQMLLRALIYRIATTDAAGWADVPEDDYRPAVDAVLARVQG